jgi:two-component system, OmpR family, phosphate regulon response regulator PhoB
MVGAMLADESKRQILIVDRDAAAVEPLRQSLCEIGFSVRAMTDGAAALSTIAERPPHLLIVDWDMPGLGALEVFQGIHKVRAPRFSRLIILSALTGEDHVVAALNLGADDYITKPYSLREAVARVAVVLRSSAIRASTPRLKFDELELDSSTNRVTAQGVPVNVCGVKYRLLEFFMSHSGQTFNRTQLLSRVWGGDTEVDERTVDVNVRRLRKILETCGCEAYIQTVQGFGYRFSPPATAQ